MNVKLIAILVALLLQAAVWAEESEGSSDDAQAETVEESERSDGTKPDQPRTMSGMSILGNEEAPKALVIVPWKSSELGEELSLSENLDDRATPVDKDVFQRELAFYEIRRSE